MCDGQTISADDYPELVEALGSNVLPNLNGRVLQGGSTAGEYKEAGLPNITGYANPTFKNIGVYFTALSNGVFYNDASTDIPDVSWSPATNKETRYRNLHFDASRCSAIYGASTTVQPPAYTVRYYICYG